MLKTIVALALFLPLSLSAANTPDCFKSLGELHKNKVPSEWLETTADDGKPMKIIVSAAAEEKFTYKSVKAGAVWMNGSAKICKDEGKVVVSLFDTKVTKEAPGYLRNFLPERMSAPIQNNEIKLRGPLGLWKGTFQGHYYKP